MQQLVRTSFLLSFSLSPSLFPLSLLVEQIGAKKVLITRPPMINCTGNETLSVPHRQESAWRKRRWSLDESM